MNDTHTLPAPDRDAFVARLIPVAGVHGPALSENPVTVSRLPSSPVHPGVGLYEVEVQLRQRPLILLAAEVDGELLLLGSRQGVDALNRRTNLELSSPETVAQYLRFWFRATQRGGDVLVEQDADFDWAPSVDSDPQDRVLRDRASHLARSVTVGHPAHGAYPAEVTALDQRTLELRHLRVRIDGTVEETIREPLMDEVPVRYIMP